MLAAIAHENVSIVETRLSNKSRISFISSKSSWPVNRKLAKRTSGHPKEKLIGTEIKRQFLITLAENMEFLTGVYRKRLFLLKEKHCMIFIYFFRTVFIDSYIRFNHIIFYHISYYAIIKWYKNGTLRTKMVRKAYIKQWFWED